MPNQEIVIPTIDPAKLKAVKDEWPQMLPLLLKITGPQYFAYGWTDDEKSPLVLQIEWDDHSSFHRFFTSPESEVFKSKLIPFVLAAAKPILFKTTVFGNKIKPNVGDIVHTAALVSTVDIESVLNVASEWSRYISEAGNAGLVFEHGLSVPYGPGGLGAEYAGPEAAQRPYVGLITSRSKETLLSHTKALAEGLSKVAKTDKYVVDATVQK